MPLIDWKMSDDDTRVATVAALMEQGKGYAEIAAACRVKKNTLSSWIYSRRDRLPRPGRIVHTKKSRAAWKNVAPKRNLAPVEVQPDDPVPVSLPEVVSVLAEQTFTPAIVTPDEALVELEPPAPLIPRERQPGPPGGVPMLQHERWMCSWPLWETPGRPPLEVILFCGAPVAAEGCSYCTEHKARTTQKILPASELNKRDPRTKAANRSFKRAGVRA